METYWNEEGNLHMRVFWKTNQELKYVNRGNTHTSACVYAIPQAVFKIMSRLTSRDENLTSTTIDFVYPDHIKALNNAELLETLGPARKGEGGKGGNNYKGRSQPIKHQKHSFLH